MGHNAPISTNQIQDDTAEAVEGWQIMNSCTNSAVWLLENIWNTDCRTYVPTCVLTSECLKWSDEPFTVNSTVNILSCRVKSVKYVSPLA